MCHTAGEVAEPPAATGAAPDVATAAPAAAAVPDHGTTAAVPAEAADDDDGSDVFIGGTPDASDADEDDSDDPDVDLEALSDDTVTSLSIGDCTTMQRRSETGSHTGPVSILNCQVAPEGSGMSLAL